VRPCLDKHRLPALAAAVVSRGKVVASGAVGTRRAGRDTAVTSDDRFHIGSDAKATTALLAAMRVGEGRLRRVLLLQCRVHHRRRHGRAREWQDLGGVGHVTGIRALGRKTAALGPQAPLGHVDADGRLKAFLSGPNGDGPLIIGPAGLAHMSVPDLARWAVWNAGEGKRGPALVKADTRKKLHTPVIDMPQPKNPPPGTPRGGKYGLGWGQMVVDWAPYPLIYNGGSNGMNLAHVWLDPKQDLALVIMTNMGGEAAKRTSHDLEARLYGKFAR
jgi:CubicO group peptidase (beta-lactamase class C family)